MDEQAVHTAAIEAARTGREVTARGPVAHEDVAKFFSAQAAWDHIDKMGPGWHSHRVMSVDEPVEAQHAAHGGKGSGLEVSRYTRTNVPRPDPNAPPPAAFLATPAPPPNYSATMGRTEPYRPSEE
jgi:hypothetical protein